MVAQSDPKRQRRHLRRWFETVALGLLVQVGANLIHLLLFVHPHGPHA